MTDWHSSTWVCGVGGQGNQVIHIPSPRQREDEGKHLCCPHLNMGKDRSLYPVTREDHTQSLDAL